MRERCTARAGKNGAILITTLWVSLILLILGMAYLATFMQDWRFAQKQVDTIEAFYLARSGLESYRACGLPPIDRRTKERRLYIPANSRLSCCIVEEDIPGDAILFKGSVLDGSGGIIAMRTIAAPREDLDRWYEIMAQ